MSPEYSDSLSILLNHRGFDSRQYGVSKVSASSRSYFQECPFVDIRAKPTEACALPVRAPKLTPTDLRCSTPPTVRRQQLQGFIHLLHCKSLKAQDTVATRLRILWCVIIAVENCGRHEAENARSGKSCLESSRQHMFQLCLIVNPNIPMNASGWSRKTDSPNP